MPPKVKPKGNAKKKKDEAELLLEENYRRTLDEIEALKDQLAKRKEVARRSKFTTLELNDNITEAGEQLKKQQHEQKTVTADMTRQYKTMQTEMNLRIHQLESERDHLQLELEKTQELLKQTIIQKDREIAERDSKIKELEKKIKELLHDFDLILRDSFNALLTKIEGSRKAWGQDATLIHKRNKAVLMEFHLNPLDI